tara:strand:+ start:2058 stop:2954 length:897 start_codon:yes stop_codon:yes gene_type:complete
MTTFDTTGTVTARFNRPSPTSRTLLEFMYVKNGTYSDPTSIKSVHIFKDTNLGSADNWLDLSSASTTYGLVAASSNASALIVFSGSTQDEADYNATPSGVIFKRSTGKYAVLLEDEIPWFDASTGAARTYYTSSTDLTAGKYWDIWTVVDNSTSSTYVHSFELFNDNIITLSEPMMVTTRQKLVQKYINKNSKIDLHITSEHTVNNTNITPEIKSVFNSTILDNAAIRIIKLKDDTSTGTPYEETLAWTSTGVSVNSDDTIIYNWNTAGAEVGTYQLQVSSTFLDQNVMSDKFNLVVR